MSNERIDIDHIDPRWEEGRDYQLVCGFEKDPKNLREEDSSRNKSKSNRFLPWRWSREDLGTVPEEPGDLALFLDPDTDEWVLEEFMGEWWFEKTRKLCGPSAGGSKNVESGHLLKLSQTVGPSTRRKRSINAKEIHKRRTVEEKEEIAKKVTETWKNRPAKEKLEISERRAEKMREVHRNYTPEMRELRVQKAAETKSNYPPEKKAEISEKISKATSLAAANRSPEEKARLHGNLSKKMKKKKWWVNPEGETLRSENCPGEGWRPGRKFTNPN
jgi:hypothetical protein